MESALEKFRVLCWRALRIKRDDVYVVEAVLAAALSARFPVTFTKPWLLLQGPPGSGKSELLNCLSEVPWCRYLETLTTNALVSGATGGSSLMAELDRAVLVMHDFQAALEQDKEVLAKQLGELRAAFDGALRKWSGTEGSVAYNATFTVIGGVTDHIEKLQEKVQPLGERFLRVQLPTGSTFKERRLFATYARSAAPLIGAWRARLSQAAYRMLERCDTGEEAPPVGCPKLIGKRIDELASLLSEFRTMADGILCVRPEIASRPAKQLTSLALCRAYLDGRGSLDDSDVAFCARIAQGTLPQSAAKLLVVLSKGRGSYLPAKAVAVKVGLKQSSRAVANQLRQYASCGLLVQYKGSYRLTDEVIKIIDRNSFFS